LRRALSARGTTQIARPCAPLQALSCPMPSRSSHGRRLLEEMLRSDLRLRSDGMKLQPAGSHQSRLSAGPPAVPSSSQPCMKLHALYHDPRALSRAAGLFFVCFTVVLRLSLSRGVAWLILAGTVLPFPCPCSVFRPDMIESLQASPSMPGSLISCSFPDGGAFRGSLKPQ